MGRSIAWVVGLLVAMGAAWFVYDRIGNPVERQVELPDVSLTDGQRPQANVDGGVDARGQAGTGDVPAVDLVPPASNGAARAN